MNDKIYDYMDWPEIEAVVYGEETAPKDLMSPRLTPDGVLVQGFFPGAESVEVVVGKKTYAMEQEDEAGYFAALLPERKIPEYFYKVTKGEETVQFADPYAYPGQITEEEEKAFCAGVYYDVYQKLGAHPMNVHGMDGTYFAVWAPNAVCVQITVEKEEFEGRCLMMHRMPMSGIFELFVPGISAGISYQYEIKIKGGEILRKADPYGNEAVTQPALMSVVASLDDFQWKDQKWMDARRKYDQRNQPVSIYETNLKDWKKAEDLVTFLTVHGYTHVELMPVMEYQNDETNGYSTAAYYAPTRRYGTPKEFQLLIDTLHQAGIGVILDWTPAQFPRVEGGMQSFDGTPLYEVANPSMAVHPFWNTMLYNYDSPMVADFLIGNACFWLEVYHVDGLRFDDVDAMLYLDYGRKPGEWIPNLYGTNENLPAIEFLKHLNSILKKKNPGVLLIAQEDGLWPELTDTVENDHLGFDYKWSGGWTNDFLSYLKVDPIVRKNRHDQLTLSLLYAYCEHYVLTLGKRDVGNLADFADMLPGNEAQKLAQVREAYSYMMLHPGCKMMSPDVNMPEGLALCIKDLNALYNTQPAMYLKDDSYDGFEWIQLMNSEQNVISFLRLTDKPEETLLAVCNFAAIPYKNYQVGVPFYGKYKEIFNSDHEKYGGEGIINARMKTCKREECDERTYSIKLNLPALGVAVFSCTPAKEPAVKEAPAKKAVAKEASVKKTPVKKAAVKKTPVKKATAEEAAVKTTAVKKDVQKLEDKKAETIKLEDKKPEAKKLENKKPEAKKLEDKKPEAKKLETRKTQAVKLETTKAAPKKLETKKAETKKLENKKVEPEKLENKKPEEKKLEIKK